MLTSVRQVRNVAIRSRQAKYAPMVIFMSLGMMVSSPGQAFALPVFESLSENAQDVTSSQPSFSDGGKVSGQEQPEQEVEKVRNNTQPSNNTDVPVRLINTSLNDGDDFSETDGNKIAREFGPRLINNIRLRYEGVDDDAFVVNGNALTLRYRGTLETHIFNKTTFLAEVEAVGKLINDFDDGSGNREDRPVVIDPDGIELNRLQILTEIIPNTRVTIGRQRIVLDDERFIGQLAFRQNDQTFDAVRASVRLLDGNVTLDTGYIRRTNRIFGNDNPVGVFRGDSVYANLNIPSPLGRVSVFNYALDLTTGLPESPVEHFATNTYGARLIGRRYWGNYGLVWEASYARQSDYTNNPVDFNANYWLGSLEASNGPLTLNFRAEILGDGDNDAMGFITPLGTLHRFQGDADIFLTTPAEGIVDLAPKLEWNIGSIGIFSEIKASARYHHFSAERGGETFGEEIDLFVRAKYKRSTFSVGYANYQARTFATDTERLFITFIHPF